MIEFPFQLLKRLGQCIKKKLHAYFITAWKKAIIVMSLKTLYYIRYSSQEKALLATTLVSIYSIIIMPWQNFKTGYTKTVSPFGVEVQAY